MKRMKYPVIRIYPKRISLILLFFIIGIILVFLTAGHSSQHLAQSTIVPLTQSVKPVETEAISPPHESDLTNGLILAGAVLVLVILVGTLHATWGFRKPVRTRGSGIHKP